MAFGNFYRAFFFFSQSADICAQPESAGIHTDSEPAYDLNEFEDSYTGPHARIADIESIFDESAQTHNFARCL